jgi:hypothetical protein
MNISDDQSHAPFVDKCRTATQPDMVQVAPGEWAPARRGATPPELTLATWKQNTSGTYYPVPVTDRLVRLTRKLVGLLGFPGMYNTLLRLGDAGFVELVRVAPNTHMLNLDSYYNHLRRCAEDPTFWADQRRLKQYRSTYQRVPCADRRASKGRPHA